MVSVKQDVIPAFPLGPSTKVYTGGQTGLIVYKGNILRMLVDGDITVNFPGGSITVSAKAGEDYVFTDGIDTVDISADCMIG